MPHEFLPADPCRIELVEDEELRFWTRAFGCSAEHLLDAIESVGVEAVAVGNYLAMRSHLNTIRVAHMHGPMGQCSMGRSSASASIATPTPSG